MRMSRILVTNAALLVAGTISAFGQTIATVSNKLGLDVASESIDAEASRAKIVRS
jgi:hypothetical protein